MCSESCRAEGSVVLAAEQETATWVHLPVPEGHKDECADSGPAQQHMIQPDDCTLFTELSRPMPDYALEHVFAQHGPIEWVSSLQTPVCPSLWQTMPSWHSRCRCLPQP